MTKRPEGDEEPEGDEATEDDEAVEEDGGGRLLLGEQQPEV